MTPLKLTKPQLELLKDISVSNGKSGAFYVDLGNSATSLHWLERKGMIRSVSRGYSGSRNWQYWITDDGKRFLETLKRDEG